LDDGGLRPVKRKFGCLAENYDASAAALEAATRVPKPLLDKLENHPILQRRRDRDGLMSVFGVRADIRIRGCHVRL